MINGPPSSAAILYGSHDKHMDKNYRSRESFLNDTNETAATAEQLTVPRPENYQFASGGSGGVSVPGGLTTYNLVDESTTSPMNFLQKAKASKIA